ncbi:SGNH hydrolase [Stipitochalara longipes BDJ]|nr:SGNH hydrolase [Stipitochalara longipes BDJ]
MASQMKLGEVQIPENQGLSKTGFRKLLQAEMKFKTRSHNTYHKIHAPELKNRQAQSLKDSTPNIASINSSSVDNIQIPSPTNLPTAIDTVLIGDSMLERLKTTGAHTQIAHLPSSFNAGVGGDKIENVLYRLDFGMMDLLEEQNVKVWVVMVGTNNLKKTHPLLPVEVERYRLLLQSLLSISPKSQIIACGLFKRKDVGDQYVEESNELLRNMLSDFDKNLGIGQTIHWVEAPVGITKEHLVDHVHLNEEGYRIWDQTLYVKLQELLGKLDTSE